MYEVLGGNAEKENRENNGDNGKEKEIDANEKKDQRQTDMNSESGGGLFRDNMGEGNKNESSNKKDNQSTTKSGDQTQSDKGSKEADMSLSSRKESLNKRRTTNAELEASQSTNNTPLKHHKDDKGCQEEVEGDIQQNESNTGFS